MTKPRKYHSSALVTRLEKSARLVVLLELDQDGLLEGHTLQAIADAFGDGLHRSTILDDLRQLKQIKRLRAKIIHRLDRDKLKLREK